MFLYSFCVDFTIVVQNKIRINRKRKILSFVSIVLLKAATLKSDNADG